MLCYREHPFEDGAKLRILNANYKLPEGGKYAILHDLIRSLLIIDPRKRPDIHAVIRTIEALASKLNVNLYEPSVKKTQRATLLENIH